MNLAQFVSRTLIEIAEGVQTANAELGHGQKLGPHFAMKIGKGDAVQFDVAVTVGTKATSGAEGGFELKIAGIRLGAGGDKASAIEGEVVSRVRFSVDNTALLT